MDRLNGTPKESTLSALNCDESCKHDHPSEVWLASEDKWFCDKCLQEFWWDELSELIMQGSGWDGESDENAILDRTTIEAQTDAGDEFTHFLVDVPDQSISRFEITLAELETELNKGAK
jgi:hypothetical protein